MAGPRYLRYIIFAVISLALILFISSSSSAAPKSFRDASQSLSSAFGKSKSESGGVNSPSTVGDNDVDNGYEDGSDTNSYVKPELHVKPDTSAGDEDEEEIVDEDDEYADFGDSDGGSDSDSVDAGSSDEEYLDPGMGEWSSATGKTAADTTKLGSTAPGKRMNATFVTLARNSDVWEIADSIRQVEDRFNRRFNYDWVFLNDQPFDEHFKKVTTALVSGKTKYGLIPEEHWSFPEHIDQDKAAAVRKKMAEAKIIYGDSISYRHMCRFESGFFFQQPLMLEYEWYWRVEPSIKLYCDIEYDTFKFMADNGKKYSFTLSLYEYFETIPTLWKSVKGFIKKFPEHIVEGNSMGFLSDDGGKTYNKCHFWSNFEIGNLDWLRSKAYTDYFNHLDQAGGFFYERWGDAPVHSIAAGLLLKKEEIHFFNDIAYYHVPFTHCPTGEKYRLDHKCHCKPGENFDWNGYSCTAKFYDLHGWDKPAGYEKEHGG